MTAKPEPLLKGLKVVEMATWLFGPMSACILGELGADVIKIEPHEGDPMRGLIHRVRDNVDWVFEIANRNKRSIALNVRTPGGQRRRCASCWPTPTCSSSTCAAAHSSGWASTMNRSEAEPSAPDLRPRHRLRH